MSTFRDISSNVLSAPDLAPQKRHSTVVDGVAIRGHFQDENRAPPSQPSHTPSTTPQAFFDTRKVMHDIYVRSVRPKGLRRGEDGRLRCGAAPPPSAASAGDEINTYLDAMRGSGGGDGDALTEKDMHPRHRGGGSDNITALSRYAVNCPNKVESQDTHLTTLRPVGKGDATADRVQERWAQAHLENFALPGRCLPQPTGGDFSVHASLYSSVLGEEDPLARLSANPVHSQNKIDMNTKSIRVKVDTPTGVTHTMELPEGLDTTLSSLLIDTLLIEETEKQKHRFPATLSDFSVGDSQKAIAHYVANYYKHHTRDVALLHKGKEVHLFDTVGEVGGHHLCRFALRITGEMKVENSKRRQPATRSNVSPEIDDPTRGTRRVQREMKNYTTTDILSKFVAVDPEGGVAGLSPSRTVGDPNGLEPESGAAVAVAMLSQPWEKIAGDKGWRRPSTFSGTSPSPSPVPPRNEDAPPFTLDPFDEKVLGASVSSIIESDIFEIGTPVDRSYDEDTQRVVLMDATGKRAAVFESGTSKNEVDQVVPITDHPMRSFLILLYEQRGDKEKIKDVDLILYSFQDQEDLLVEVLDEKYAKQGSAETIRAVYSDYVKEIRQQRDASFGPTVEAYDDDATGNKVYEDAEHRFFLEGPPAYPLSQHPVRQYFVDFLKQKAPQRLKEVDELLWDNQYEEAALYERLVDEYGPPPTQLPPYSDYATHAKKVQKGRSVSAFDTPLPVGLVKSVALREEGGWREVRGRGASADNHFVNHRGRVTYNEDVTPFGAAGAAALRGSDRGTVSSLQTMSDVTKFTDSLRSQTSQASQRKASSEVSSHPVDWAGPQPTPSLPASTPPMVPHVIPPTNQMNRTRRPSAGSSVGGAAPPPPPPPPPPVEAVDPTGPADAGGEAKKRPRKKKKAPELAVPPPPPPPPED